MTQKNTGDRKIKVSRVFSHSFGTDQVRAAWRQEVLNGLIPTWLRIAVNKNLKCRGSFIEIYKNLC